MFSTHKISKKIKKPDLLKILQNDIDKVNKIIKDQLDSPVELLKLISKNLVNSGGKRIRPALTLACSKLFGEIENISLFLAAAVEMIHSATLLHDDVIDMATHRRGIATSNMMWGNTASVLAGDYLFAKAFELMVASRNLDILNILAKVSSIIAQGEVHQLATRYDIHLSFEDYLHTIGAKTASLFAASCEVGGIAMACSEAQAKALYNFGYYLGLAFQMTDDTLDYRLDLKNLGKTTGNDMREGKITLPIILAIEKDIEVKFWKDAFAQDMNENQYAFNLQKAYQLLNHYQIFNLCHQKIQHYTEKALKNLDFFLDNDIKFSIHDFVVLQQGRSH